MYGDEIWFYSLFCLSDHNHLIDKRETLGERAEDDARYGQEVKGLSRYPEMARLKILGVVWMSDFFRLFGLTDPSLFIYRTIALLLVRGV